VIVASRRARAKNLASLVFCVIREIRSQNPGVNNILSCGFTDLAEKPDSHA
jgi:hypothetical protein